MSTTYSYNCDFCSLTTRNNTRLKSHLASRVPGESFKCDFCDKSWCTKRGVKFHMTKTHLNKIPGETFICDVCDFSATSRVFLRNHLKLNHKDFEVNDASFSSIPRKTFQKEQNEVHETYEIKEEEEEAYDIEIPDEYESNEGENYLEAPQDNQNEAHNDDNVEHYDESQLEDQTQTHFVPKNAVNYDENHAVNNIENHDEGFQVESSNNVEQYDESYMENHGENSDHNAGLQYQTSDANYVENHDANFEENHDVNYVENYDANCIESYDENYSVNYVENHEKSDMEEPLTFLPHKENEIQLMTKKLKAINSAFKCPYCDLIFLKYPKAQKHLLNRRHGVIYQCNFCPTKMCTSIGILYHLKKKHGVKKTPSQLDPKLRGYTVTHEIQKESEAPIRTTSMVARRGCPHCDMEARDEQTLLKHLSKRKDGVMFQCNFCPKKWCTTSGRDLHMSMAHRQPAEKDNIKDGVKIKTEDTGGKNHQPKLKRDRAGIFKCPDCDMVSATEEGLLNHFKVRKEGTLYHCDFCPKIWCNKKGIELHMKRAHMTLKKPDVHPQFFCEVCDYGAHSAEDLKMHITLKHRDYEVPVSSIDTSINGACNSPDINATMTVNFSFRPNESLKVPGSKLEITLKVEKCDQCDYTSTRKSLLTKHKKFRDSEDGVTIINCEICDMALCSEKALKSHMRYRHADKMKTLSHKHETYKCDFCDLVTTSYGGIKYHMSHVSNLEVKSPFVCDICQFKGCTKALMARHKLKNHGLSTYVTKPAPQYSCDKCDYTTFKSNNYESHLRFMGDGEDIQLQKCEICHIRLCSSEALFRHRRARHDVRKKRRYGTKTNFIEKRYRKEGAKKKIFADKTIKCEQCYKILANRHVYKRHLHRVHNVTFDGVIADVEVKQCDFCPFTTKYKQNLLRHMNLKHEEFHEKMPVRKYVKNHKTYDCPHCDMEARTEGSLQKHLSQRKDGVMFHCDFCPKKWCTRLGVIFHMARAHPKPTDSKVRSSFDTEQLDDIPEIESKIPPETSVFCQIDEIPEMDFKIEPDTSVFCQIDEIPEMDFKIEPETSVFCQIDEIPEKKPRLETQKFLHVLPQPRKGQWIVPLRRIDETDPV